MINGDKSARGHFIPIVDRIKNLPFWFLALVLLGILAFLSIFADNNYSIIAKALGRGLGTTIYVSLIAYVFAAVLGLIWGLMRVSKLRVFREISTFYIEIVRGVPMLVILYYIAFVGAPALVDFMNFILKPLIKAGVLKAVSIRNMNFVWRAILALCLGYSAFIAEIFRAGIESIDAGQMEAALALGMGRGKAMFKVILPQAVRNVLPPLGNEFIAMIKDSALVSALGVQDITQLGKVYSASTFKFFETYNVVALLYLVMTISLSMLIRFMEKRLARHKRSA